MIINITAVPGAKKPEVSRISDNEYKVKIDARAQDGKANERLVELLSEHFSVPKSHVRIVKGAKSKRKIVEIIY